MPFKVVQTFEGKKYKLFTVPCGWETNNILRYPKKSILKYIKDENSTPTIEWDVIKCKVKRSNIISYENGEKLVSEMLKHSDTEDDVDNYTQRRRSQNKKTLKLNSMAQDMNVVLTEDSAPSSADLPVELNYNALCITICLASTPSSNEEMARDFLEHVLKIPNPDKVLSSVLGRLERHRQQGLSRQQNSNEDCEDPSELLPEYTETLQDSRERELRQLGVHVQKHYPICHMERKIKKLNTNEYEYRPAYYEEVRCTAAQSDDIGESNEICSSLGFSCVQWNKTIHLTRRRYSSDCWETRTLVIPAGCECMWPVHRLGDMKLHV